MSSGTSSNRSTAPGTAQIGVRVVQDRRRFQGENVGYPRSSGRVGEGWAMFDHIFRGSDIAIIVLRGEGKGKARFDDIR